MNNNILNIARQRYIHWLRRQPTDALCKALQLLYMRPEMAVTAQQETLLIHTIARRHDLTVHNWFRSVYAVRDTTRYMHGTPALRDAQRILNKYLYDCTPIIQQGMQPPNIDTVYWCIVHHLPDGVREKYWKLGDNACSAARRYARLLAAYKGVSKITRYKASVIAAVITADAAYTRVAQGWRSRKNAVAVDDGIVARATAEACVALCAQDDEYTAAMVYAQHTQDARRRLDAEQAQLSQDAQRVEDEIAAIRAQLTQDA